MPDGSLIPFVTGVKGAAGAGFAARLEEVELVRLEAQIGEQRMGEVTLDHPRGGVQDVQNHVVGRFFR